MCRNVHSRTIRSTNRRTAKNTGISGCNRANRKKTQSKQSNQETLKTKGEQPLYARALQAGLLTEIEAQQMQAVELARRNIIAVNDFAKEDI